MRGRGAGGRSRGRPGIGPMVVGLLVQACATAAPPSSFEFASVRDPANAYACVVGVLAREGFTVERSAEEGIAVAFRRADGDRPSADDGGRTWWRVELGTSLDERRRTVVRGTAGSAPRREGPYGAADLPLEHLVGAFSGACMWGSTPGSTSHGGDP